MGKRVLLAALIVATMVTGLVSMAPASHGGFHAELDGYQEVPSISTPATTVQGSFRATIVNGRIKFALGYSDLAGVVSAAHIHFAQKRVNGGVIAFLCGGGGKPACPPSPGTVNGAIGPGGIIGPSEQGIAPGEFDEAVAAMEAGATYVNVHTDLFPNGEIRGQVLAD